MKRPIGKKNRTALKMPFDGIGKRTSLLRIAINVLIKLRIVKHVGITGISMPHIPYLPITKSSISPSVTSKL